MHKKIFAGDMPTWLRKWSSHFSEYPFGKLNLKYTMSDQNFAACEQRLRQNSLYGRAYTYVTNTNTISLDILNMLFKSLTDSSFKKNISLSTFDNNSPKKVLLIGPGKNADEINTIINGVPNLTNVSIIEANPESPFYFCDKIGLSPNAIELDLLLTDIMALTKGDLPDYLNKQFDLCIDCHVFDREYFRPSQLDSINCLISRMMKPQGIELSVFMLGQGRLEYSDKTISTSELAEKTGLKKPYLFHSGFIKVSK